MKRALPHVALSLAAIYVILSIAAAVCLFDHATSKISGHHSSQHKSGAQTHSTLCAWACQANPGASLIAATPFVPVTLVQFLVVPANSPVLFPSVSSQLHLRGPPSLS